MTYKLETLFPTNFSASMLDDLGRCELYWFRKYVQRLGGSARNPDLIAGGLFAKACELTRKGFYNEGLSSEEAVELGEEHILTGENTEDDLKSNERVAYSFVKYWKSFPLDNKSFKPVELIDGTHAIEYQFLFDLGIPHPDIPNQNICFTGKLDGIYNYFQGGRATKLVLTDEKTCKSVYRIAGTKNIDITKERNMYVTSGQFLSYLFAVRQLINNGIIQTDLKLEELIVNRVPITKEYEPAFQLNIEMSEWQTNMFGIFLVNRIKDLIAKYEYYKENNYLPFIAFTPALTGSACNSYARPCSYGVGCQSEFGEELLESNFKQVVWDKESGKEMELVEFKKKLGVI
jgi:hypothetical protein